MTVEGLSELLKTLGAQYAAASPSDIIPVALELHADAITPVGVCETFIGDETGFLLESVEEGQRYGRFSFLGRSPIGRFTTWGDQSEASGVLDTHSHDGFEVAKTYLENLSVGSAIGSSVSDIPFAAGLVGVFGWDSVRAIENLPPRKPSLHVHPDAVLLAVGELVAFDHLRQTVTLIVNAVRGTPWEEVESALQRMVADLFRPAELFAKLSRSRNELPVAPTRRSISGEEFRRMVGSAKEFIEAGDVFQIVLSQQFDVGPITDSFAVYRTLRQVNPSSYLYYVQTPDVTVIGASPESLVRMREGRITTRPIAGSRPRGDNEQENQLRAASLREDPKEIAEHVMLVDLGRNDIGRVAEFGSVSVDQLMSVETYSHIMHLTSEVSGTLRSGLDAVDVLRATFPAGTLSGAPKVRAMELITDIEPYARGLYGGAIGYFDSRGNFDTAILIRTLVVDKEGRGSVQAGAGIVWDSDPASEDEECLAKAEAILRAVGGSAS
ncbi:MAG: chorismate-binding protein [Acidobacteria bacterium]|nr:chorismate-binding protein [Acidobacteriota bacterium]